MVSSQAISQVSRMPSRTGKSSKTRNLLGGSSSRNKCSRSRGPTYDVVHITQLQILQAALKASNPELRAHPLIKVMRQLCNGRTSCLQVQAGDQDQCMLTCYSCPAV
jgi:hypothetical protein